MKIVNLDIQSKYIISCMVNGEAWIRCSTFKFWR